MLQRLPLRYARQLARPFYMAHVLDLLFLAKPEELRCLTLDKSFECEPPNMKFNEQEKNHCRASSRVEGENLSSTKGVKLIELTNRHRVASGGIKTGSWRNVKNNTATSCGNIPSATRASSVDDHSKNIGRPPHTEKYSKEYLRQERHHWLSTRELTFPGDASRAQHEAKMPTSKKKEQWRKKAAAKAAKLEAAVARCGAADPKSRRCAQRRTTSPDHGRRHGPEAARQAGPATQPEKQRALSVQVGFETRFARSPDSHPAPGRGPPPRPTRRGGAERFPQRSPSRGVSPDLQSGIFALRRAFSA
ncbi:hypothetical protein AURANDRAFT_66758 [Aureococcus anophagefferens]|uniref:Uncharacterized protein n=1 Tax=Aureococcus anophagefferens TaxID=44056 RepID=F0YIP3_AURAN|nr:hypothetical protein AURANDRAFT_66758 [Aureococcus anophagefferens]EGB05021.1 hypothetical protein AURANDRAFT_66758 [Aureococcus anophagefferens]|eukprot:XP_009040372.1 hypothetical protein AURANDRAFT_66758 [Aureococcus anophagefferens]